MTEPIFTETLHEAFDRAGLPFPDREPETGRLCRFPTNGRKDDAAGWLRIFPDGAGAVFGDWRTGDGWTWQRRDTGAPPPTAEERAALRAKAEQQRRQAEADRERQHNDAAERAGRIIANLRPATAAHEYVKRKGIRPVGALLDLDGRLVLPVLDDAGRIQSVQHIAPDGTKQFLPGGMMKGGRLILGTPADGSPLLVCEGWATGASLHEATGITAAIAFSGSNMKPVAADMRRKYPKSTILIAGDLDAHGAGAKYAEAAKAACKPSCVVLPAFKDGRLAGDYNDLHAAEGLDEVKRQIDARTAPPVWPTVSGSVADFLDTPPPALPWFARERLLANRAHLLTGLGGTSKTTCLYHLGIAAVTGRLPWPWEIERTGAALLLLAEDDTAAAHRTIAAHARHSGLTNDERGLIAERLRVFPMAGQNCRLLAAGPNGTLRETTEARGLFELARRIPNLRFIGLDPALALTDGDEMNAAHQRRLGEFADRLALETGACVVLSSHAAKALNAADELGSHTSRGSGAITDTVRAEIVLRTMTAQEARKYGITDVAERKSHVQLALTKSNACPPAAFAPLWLKRGAGGLLSLAELEEPEAGAGAVGKREWQALDILRELSAGAAAPLKDWRAACAAAGLLTGKNSDAIEKSMRRIVVALLAAGEIGPGACRGVYTPIERGAE